MMVAGEMNNNITQEDTIESLQAEYDNLFNKLRTQRQVFFLKWLETRNVKKSATEAGYSSKTAIVQGSRLLRSDTISKLVTLSTRLLALRSRISQDWIMAELKVNYEVCVKEGKHQAATRNLELMGQQLGMFGKGEKEKGGDLHLHAHKYVNYPPVPESIKAWVDQMKEIGYEAQLPENTQQTGEDNEPGDTKEDS